MEKIVKISWVLWLSIRKYGANYRYYRKTRCSNSFEVVWLGLRISVGRPWHKTVVEYEVLNSYGRQVEGIEKVNKQNLDAPGFRIRMPKKKYILPNKK